MASVLIDRPLHEDALKILEKEAEVIAVFNDDEAELADAIKKVNGIICSAALKMSREKILSGSALRVIGRPGVGYDSVDVDAATEACIPVVYTPDGPTESVAEHVIGLMIMLAKKINVVEKAFREKNDFGIRTRVTGMELQGKTLGIVGAGRIGRRTAEIAEKGLEMKILFFDPYISQEPAFVRDLPELLRQSDVISVHIPYSAKTEKLFDSKAFDTMKPTAFFINTSRGGVVDEDALVQALDSGKIAGAGLDVFSQEPPASDNPLFRCENTILTPHLSSFTSDGKRKMGVAVVKGVLDVLTGRRPEFIVNPEIWNTRRK